MARGVGPAAGCGRATTRTSPATSRTWCRHWPNSCRPTSCLTGSWSRSTRLTGRWTSRRSGASWPPAGSWCGRPRPAGAAGGVQRAGRRRPRPARPRAGRAPATTRGAARRSRKRYTGSVLISRPMESRRAVATRTSYTGARVLAQRRRRRHHRTVPPPLADAAGSSGPGASCSTPCSASCTLRRAFKTRLALCSPPPSPPRSPPPWGGI